MPTFTPRLAVVLVALSAISGAVPLAAQGTPAMATIYLKEGGVIHGQILNENDPNGVRIKSAKSGTTFLLKTVWIDSIVKAPTAPAAPAAPAGPPRRHQRAVRPPATSSPRPLRPPWPRPRLPSPRSLRSAVCLRAAPSAPLLPSAVVAAPARPVVSSSGRGRTRAAARRGPAAPAAKASKSSAEKKPAKFSHWYVGGGGSAPTGDMGTSTDIGYTGMLAYAAGVGKMTQLRLGGAGNYWSASSSDANVYDITGTFDVLVGKRIPGFIAPVRPASVAWVVCATRRRRRDSSATRGTRSTAAASVAASTRAASSSR